MNGGGRVGSDLIDDSVRTRMQSGYVAARSGYAHNFGGGSGWDLFC
ncbi:hypothetical protein ADUPG1_005725, partial [Aduncisulcus paluster]